MAFKLKLDGLEETLKKLEKMDDEVKADVDKEIDESTKSMVQLMQGSVPSVTNKLRNSIKREKVSEMHYTITAGEFYAAYVNWGTVTRVKVEKDWKEFAILFKGKGIRKTGGIYPTFFFTGSVEAVKFPMIERLKKLINK